MHVTRTTFLPVLAGPDDPQLDAAHLLEDFVGELTVGYTVGPPFGQRLVTWDELDSSGMRLGQLRRQAASNLYTSLHRVGIHGQPPALMLSFDGLESSVLLAHPFWDDLARSIPGDLVVGAPARDVVIFTGSQSQPGLKKVRRAVERIFFAGATHLLSRDLLVRRGQRWELFRPASPAIPRQRTPQPSGPGR